MSHSFLPKQQRQRAGTLTPERTKLLDELGFAWSLPNSTKSKSSGMKRRRQSANVTPPPTKSITPAVEPKYFADMPDEDIVAFWRDVTPSDDDFAQTFENLILGKGAMIS